MSNTLWIRRMEHRKSSRGRIRLPKLVQTIAPSVLFPVFNPPYPQGIYTSRHLLAKLLVAGVQGPIVASADLSLCRGDVGEERLDPVLPDGKI